MKTIVVLGCGWLGLPLATRLAADGFRVKGSTTRAEKLPALAAAGVEPYLVRLEDPRGADLDRLLDADALFLNVPPGRGTGEAEGYREKMRRLGAALADSPVRLLVFASSTSVYPDAGRAVTEEDAPEPATPSGRALAEAERLFRSRPELGATVLRLGGLYGGSRHPGRFLAGKKGLADGRAPVNLVHLDDALEIARLVLVRAIRGAIFNVCADEHPTREQLYGCAARALGLDPPVFLPGPPAGFKIVDNRRVKAALGYRFRHPDPLDACAPPSSGRLRPDERAVNDV